MSQLRCVTSFHDGKALIELKGDLTYGNLDAFRPEVVRAHRRSPLIVLDFDRVKYMDSAGIGELMAVRKQILRLGGTLRLCRLPGRIRGLLETHCLLQFFRVYRSQSEAVMSFKEITA